MDLTDEQWAIIEPLTPEEERIPKPRRGQPRRLPRDVRNGILGILPSDAPWKDVPARYPPSQTCHRRFQRWVQMGVMEERAPVKDLKERGGWTAKNGASMTPSW
ncbi:MAG: transposase [Chloroflexus sp.]|uniref:transposase n=1 Tax=Chloroflexus sp. TaxID=1904827 RepID=UPI003C72422F